LKICKKFSYVELCRQGHDALLSGDKQSFFEENIASIIWVEEFVTQERNQHEAGTNRAC
jgi:hypothetical protein